MTKPLFELGQVVATPGALEAIETCYGETAKNAAALLLARHIRGDWGDLDAHDRAVNNAAVAADETRILSAYHLPDETKLWIITEADRTSTTILLPEEY